MMKKQDTNFTCPSCKKKITKTNENKSFPFCSKRCQMIDLGQWLTEKYVVEAPIDRKDKKDEQ